MTSKIQQIMDSLHCTEEEAKSVIAYDEKIENGEKTEYDLSKEKQNVVKEYTKVQPTVYKFTTREKKENPTKKELISAFYEFSQGIAENVQILNAERQISFTFADNQYELTLVQKRKPKNGE